VNPVPHGIRIKWLCESGYGLSWNSGSVSGSGLKSIRILNSARKDNNWYPHEQVYRGKNFASKLKIEELMCWSICCSSVADPGCFIPDPDPDPTIAPSRIRIPDPGGKKHRIPDPQHCSAPWVQTQFKRTIPCPNFVGGLKSRLKTRAVSLTCIDVLNVDKMSIESLIQCRSTIERPQFLQTDQVDFYWIGSDLWLKLDQVTGPALQSDSGLKVPVCSFTIRKSHVAIPSGVC
jgi:hypothetical protein